jgi:hypothetical protein
LAAPATLRDAVRSGPIRRQADEVDEMLRDELEQLSRSVALAAELPVTEAVEAAFDIEERAGVALGEVFVNQFDDVDDDVRDELDHDELARLPRVSERSWRPPGRI